MKDIKKQEKNMERELLAEKQNAAKSISRMNSQAALAALAQGIIPQTLEKELFEGLSRMGNYSFWQAVERKENRSRILDKYVESETFSQEESNIILRRLAGDFTVEFNKVEELPERKGVEESRLLPDAITEANSYLSLLTPVFFDQGVFELSEDSSTGPISPLMLTGAGDTP